ncbi:hypothetical protein IMCC14465_14810 [alpha proteobacterium IMCC14465]|uniref:Uncharacterized protein n=1 Tax=alpha proteobacterium IMCC14465 TaxID=1220535 RepID=J9A5P1_9PROT|nr:hypothetical protein IMCC14465_14810 [alpha proteobacterium IMCC14465]
MNNQTVKLQLNHKSKQSLRHLTASYKRRTSFVQASNRENVRKQIFIMTRSKAQTTT